MGRTHTRRSAVAALNVKLVLWLLGLLAIAGGRLVAGDASSSNPYVSIAERNAFALRAPPSPQPPATATLPASNAAPALSLTGIADFSAKKWALLTHAEIGKPARHYTLEEGEAQDGLEVLDIDGVNATVRIRYRGAEWVLALAAPDNRRGEAQTVGKQVTGEQARAGELLQSGPSHIATLAPDGKLLTTSDGSDSVRVWDIATGQPILHSKPIRSATFTPDGKLVITVNGSDSVRVWDAATGQPLQTPR